jgi:hypothetical protein
MSIVTAMKSPSIGKKAADTSVIIENKCEDILATGVGSVTGNGNGNGEIKKEWSCGKIYLGERSRTSVQEKVSRNMYIAQYIVCVNRPKPKYIVLCMAGFDNHDSWCNSSLCKMMLQRQKKQRKMVDLDESVADPIPEPMGSITTYNVGALRAVVDMIIAFKRRVYGIPGNNWAKAVVKQFNNVGVKLVRDVLVSTVEINQTLMAAGHHRQGHHTTLKMMMEEVAQSNCVWAGGWCRISRGY